MHLLGRKRGEGEEFAIQMLFRFCYIICKMPFCPRRIVREPQDGLLRKRRRSHEDVSWEDDKL